MWIKKEDYLKLKDIEKEYRQLRNSNECANAYARYQDNQAEWWKKGYYELEKDKDNEILELRKHIIDIEYELEDLKETAFKLQQDLLNFNSSYYN